MVEPSCRRCHGPPEREGPSPSLARSRFSHRAHIAAGPGMACATCHALDARGAPVTALRGHAPCSDAACHASDFAAAAPATCGVCHVRAEPWRQLHDDPTPAELTEFGVDFSHRAHISGRTSPGPCTTCHRLAAPTGRFEPSPGHAACTGSACHAPLRGGAPPPLSRCEGCHALGSAEKREQVARGRRWSVRQRFTHEPHRAEPTGARPALPCVECHAGALTSTRIADMAAPRKASCARCHDGGAAFKLTGHTCSRCHVTPIRTATGSTSETARSAPPR
jgi:c(7)-type cytochrome triheme protein